MVEPREDNDTMPEETEGATPSQTQEQQKEEESASQEEKARPDRVVSLEARRRDFDEIVDNELWRYIPTNALILKLPAITQGRFLSLLALKTLQEASDGVWAIEAVGHLPIWKHLLSNHLMQNDLLLKKASESPLEPWAFGDTSSLHIAEEHVGALPVEIQIAAWLLLPLSTPAHRKILLMRESLIRTRSFRLGEYAAGGLFSEHGETWLGTRQSRTQQAEAALHVQLWQATLSKEHVEQVRRFLLIQINREQYLQCLI